MFREFRSYYAMKHFEEQRANYYLERANGIWRCYKWLFLDFFVPKYRRLKKEMDSYDGGWWRDPNGHPCALHCVRYIDTEKLKDGEICYELDCYFHVCRVYAYRADNQSFVLLDKQPMA